MDRARGAAIVAVVVLHAELQAVGATGGDLPVVHEANTLLAPVRMPVLVLLSGMLLTPALARPPGRYLAGKARTLLWPYLVWSAIDLAHLQLRLRLQSGDESLTGEWVLRVLHAPPTYLWFLAYLLVYYVAALALPAVVRVVGGPALLAVTALAPAATFPGDRLTWLLGWFLVGDTLGRLLRRHLRPVTVPRGDVLGHVGRHSLVYYVSHLVVAILVTDVLGAAGDPGRWSVFLACVAVPLGTGALLVAARGHRVVDCLFEWPWARAAGSTAPRPAAPHGARGEGRGGP